MQYDLIKLEIKLKEAQQEVVNCQTLSHNLSANTDRVIINKSRAVVLKSMKDLQVVEFEYKVHQVFVKRERDKVGTIEKEHNDTSLQLKNVTTQITLLDLHMSCNKTWVVGLLK